MVASDLLIYSLISGAVLTVLWGAFRLSGMSALTHHRLNRALLLAILLVSLLLPLVAFVERPAESAPVVAGAQAGAMALVADGGAAAAADGASFTVCDIMPVLSAVYLFGAGASLLWLLVGLGGVVLAVVGGERCRLDGSTTLVVHDRHIMAFSWGRWIVISRADLESSGPALLCHERAHRAAAHWADLLLSRLVSCVDWYWPSSWMLTRDLAAVHEYEADRRVLDGGVNPAEYQMLLIRKSASVTLASIVNPFNYSSLKKRITMMQKKQSSARSRMRSLALLPAAALVIYLSSAPALASAVDTARSEATQSEVVSEAYETVVSSLGTDSVAALVVINGEEASMQGLAALSRDKVLSITVDKSSSAVERYGSKAANGVIEIVTDDAPEELKQKAAAMKSSSYVDGQTPKLRVRGAAASDSGETMPVFPGGEANMWQFINSHLRYPEEAVKINAQGRVIVTFKVNADGSVSDAKVVNNSSKCEALAQEALRVTNELPDFTPGTKDGKPVAVWYSIPFKFKLQPDEPVKE